MMCSTWLSRRFPALERRWRSCAPEEASNGAVPVQAAKRALVGNRAMSPTSATTRAAPAGPIPYRSIRCDPRARTRRRSSALTALSWASTVNRSASRSAAIRRRIAPPGSRGRTVASMALACNGLRCRPAPPGTSSARRRCSRFNVAARRLDNSSRRSMRTRNAATCPSRADSSRSPRVLRATAVTACASTASVLRPCPVSSTRTRAVSFAGTSHTASPSASSRCDSGRPAPSAPSTAHTRSGHCRT